MQQLLGDELTKLTHVLVKLFKGQTNTIPRELRKNAVRYFQRIALLIDLETGEFNPSVMIEKTNDIIENSHYPRKGSYFTSDERKKFLEGDVLENIRIYLGKHVGHGGRGIVIYLTPFMDKECLSGSRLGSIKRKITLCVGKITCLIVLGDSQVNFNKKLQEFAYLDSDFKIDAYKVSSDADVRLNLSPTTTYLDGSVSYQNSEQDLS